MSENSNITRHYESGDLLERLQAALADDGADPDRPGIEALSHYDHFHGRGMEATRELADVLQVSSGDHLLDIGCGLGGPARYLSDRFDCRVTGIDLTEEFCAVARHLTQALGLAGRVAIEQGDALAMPFEDGSFDGAYSMNVSMNIADKAGLYAEVRRVLRPGAWLVLSELALGPAGHPDYPTPWALTAESSFLSTLEETLAGLEAAGFAIVSTRDTVAENLRFGARSRAMVERGEKPPQRAVTLMHGELAATAMANTAAGIKAGCLVPIEILCRKDSRPCGGDERFAGRSPRSSN